MHQIGKRALALLLTVMFVFLVSGCKREKGESSSAPSSQGQISSGEASGDETSSFFGESSESSSDLSSDVSSSQPSSSAASSSRAPSSSKDEGSSSRQPSSQSSASSRPSSSGSGLPSSSQEPENGGVPTTSTTGEEIPYDYQLLKDFSGYINLVTPALVGESFEYSTISDQQLAAAGVMLCKDMADVQEAQKIEKSRFEQEIKQYFGRTIGDSSSLSGNGFRYQSGYYQWYGSGFEDYVFEAQTAYDLGDNYIRVEGQTTLYDMDGNSVSSQDAVILLQRAPSSYYGYYLIAQAY